MASKDLHNRIKPAVALNGATVSSNTTTTGVIIDTQGYEAVEFVLRTSAYTDGTYTAKLTEGDASDLSDGAVVGAAGLLGTLPALTAANNVGSVGYRGHKRYVRLDVVSTSVTSGAHVSGTVVLGQPLVA